MCSIRALTVLSFVLTISGLQNAAAQISPAPDASERIATRAPTPLGGTFASGAASPDNAPISAQPAAPDTSNVAPSETETQGNPSSYLRDNFGIPERLSDCDKAVVPVTPDMTGPVRDLSIQKNNSARDACRATWQQHQVEIAEQQRAEDANGSVQTVDAQPRPDSGPQQESNAAIASAEPDLNTETLQPAVCGRDLQALKDVRDAVAKGDTAHARLLLDNMIDCGHAAVQDEAASNTNEPVTTPRP